LTELGPYDFFGEMSLIDDSPTSATVEAINDTTLFKMTGTDFKAITSDNNALSSKLWESITRSLTTRIRKTGELVKMYYGLSKALCENEQFRELYTSWNFHTQKSQI
jgi:CRP-like cAMP-binding protein